MKIDVLKYALKTFLKGAITIFSFCGFILLADYLSTKYPATSLIIIVIIFCFLVGCVINEFQKNKEE